MAKISFHRINASKLAGSLEEVVAEAVELGVSYVEFDIRKTSDGSLVIWHDVNLPSGVRVADVSRAQYVREVGDRACDLEKMVVLLQGKMGLHVDLKDIGYEEEVVELLLRTYGTDEFVITSLEDDSIRLIKQKHPEVRCGLSLGRDLNEVGRVERIWVYLSELFPGRRLRNCKADFAVVNYKLARPTTLRYCQSNHLPVWAWTVDDQRDMARYLVHPAVEVLITNEPWLAIELAKELAESSGSI